MLSEFQSGSPSAVTEEMSNGHIEFSDVEIKERMSGNLCRCGAYVGITDAIRQAFEELSNWKFFLRHCGRPAISPEPPLAKQLHEALGRNKPDRLSKRISSKTN